MNQARFEAFSDSVYGFAITLLVLGFVLPPLHAPSDRQLTMALLGLWPNLVAYALSFGVIGIMWQNHHALFRMVASVDRTTVFINLLLLGGTAFIPFATSTLGEYPTHRAATFLYGLVLSWCSTSYNLLLDHLVRTKAFDVHVDAARIRGTVRAYRTGWVTYVGAMLLSLVLPIVSFAAYIAIALYYVIPRGIDADLEVDAGGSEDRQAAIHGARRRKH